MNCITKEAMDQLMHDLVEDFKKGPSYPPTVAAEAQPVVLTLFESIKDSLVELDQKQRQEIYELLHNAFGCRMY